MLDHGFAGRDHLFVDCGIDKPLKDLTSEELSDNMYRMSTKRIPHLSEALALCASLQLGVMLDNKIPAPSHICLQQISKLLPRHGLEKSSVTLSTSRETKAAYRRHIKEARYF